MNLVSVSSQKMLAEKMHFQNDNCLAELIILLSEFDYLGLLSVLGIECLGLLSVLGIECV